MTLAIREISVGARHDEALGDRVQHWKRIFKDRGGRGWVWVWVWMDGWMDGCTGQMDGWMVNVPCWCGCGWQGALLVRGLRASSETGCPSHSQGGGCKVVMAGLLVACTGSEGINQ
jgi:hypothetical protein